MEPTFFFILRASSLIAFVGSAPVDRMKMAGTNLFASSVSARMSRGRESAYRLPSASMTYSCTPSSARSSRSARMSSNLSKYISIRSSKSGILTASGQSSSYQCFHTASLRVIASGRSRYTGTERESWMMCSQAASGIHEAGFGFSALASSEPPPTRSIFCCAAVRRPATVWMRIVSISDQMSLWRTKRPRCT